VKKVKSNGNFTAALTAKLSIFVATFSYKFRTGAFIVYRKVLQLQSFLEKWSTKNSNPCGAGVCFF